MRLLIEDTLATATFVVPYAAGWVAPGAGATLEARPGLRGGDVGPDDIALVSSAEVAPLAESHRVAPDAAVVAGSVGAVSLRTPVRPDEVERGPVRLLGTSGAGELLARATLRPFYGIEATAWPGAWRGLPAEGTAAATADDDRAIAAAQAVVVEGAEALRTPEAGFAEDLCRAWLILTGVPAVTHVLVVPAEAEQAALAPALALLAALREAGLARRREWRRGLAEREGLALDRVHAFFAEQRLALTGEDRRALALLLQRGGRGSAYPPLGALRFLDPAPEAP